MWAALALLVAAAPDGANAGSVPGPFMWAELRGSLQAMRFFATPMSMRQDVVFPQAQARVVGGFRLAAGNHGFLLGASVEPTVMSNPLAASWQAARATINVTPKVGGVFNFDRWTLVATLGVPVVLWGVKVAPSLRARVKLGPVLLGGEASGTVGPEVFQSETLPVAAPFVPRLCPFGATWCIDATASRWSARGALLAEWFIDETWSIAARASFDTTREVYVYSANDVPVVLTSYNVWQRNTERFETIVSWAPFKYFGISIDGGLSFEHRHFGFTTLSWVVGLSFWVRTDQRLSRNWIDL